MATLHANVVASEPEVRMKPFDFPSDNPLDWLHADLCRPAERKSYVSNPPDDVDHERVDVVLERRNTAITPGTDTLRFGA